MTTFTILLGGELFPTARLKRQIAGSRIIAADSGILHAAALGAEPELWVGDFDSVTPARRAGFAHVPQKEFPSEKDTTDGELAVEEAIARGATSLNFVGAFGGKRADHAWLHLATAVSLAERGMAVLLSSGNQEGVPLMPGRRAEFDYPAGTLFSIIGFTAIEGLTIAGVHWPLEKRHVPFGSSLTISNLVLRRLTVEFAGGRAVLIAHLGDTA
jgi:thiamine pyrophosphokinase